MDDFSYQLSIEHMAWEKFKFYLVLSLQNGGSTSTAGHRTNRKQNNDDSTEELHFKLPCIFSRFCKRNKFPMLVDPTTVAFHSTKCGIMVEAVENTYLVFTFPVFWNNFHLRHPSFNDNVKQSDDEYVRDVLTENRLAYQTKLQHINPMKTVYVYVYV